MNSPCYSPTIDAGDGISIGCMALALVSRMRGDHGAGRTRYRFASTRRLGASPWRLRSSALEYVVLEISCVAALSASSGSRYLVAG